ncbi:MAG: Insulinase (Peptidase M16) [Phylliscum demangeonii]|nr:MAG: Insulinase (Peptidase M16) [Phylliscum demangeonii]
MRSHEPVQRVADHLERPALDDRSYRVVLLSNKLEVLLVHDPETDKASAAMDVNVGDFSDPEDMPGMAHAVEHLLFMGTDKYPKENAYREYLTAHSGYSNAYTADTSTNYYFEVAATAHPDTASNALSPKLAANESVGDRLTSPLFGALDRFAQFFIAPLFLASSLDRELQAVNSENEKNLQNDTWRLYQLSKSTANPAHPYCHFSTGNLETLRDRPKEKGLDVRQEFIRFHEKHYSANQMKLVILGRESLDQLESWTLELFSRIPNKNLPQKRWDDVQPLTKSELLTQCFAKPVMDFSQLELTFPFVDEEFLYEAQPGRYLSHLIGHEGPGSILAHIKKQGWATELTAGSSQVCPGSALFEMNVRLTEEGLKNYQEIVKVIFQYISLVRETSPQEWIFKEMKEMAEVNFRFKQKSPASAFTSKISAVMQRPIPRDWLLSNSRLLRKFDADAIIQATQCLRADNFRLTVVSQRVPQKLEERERWYGTEYKLEKIPSKDLDEFVKAERSGSDDRLAELHLPRPNAFMPTRLEVEKKEVSEPRKAPSVIRDDADARLWWKKDDRFWVPKASLYIKLRSPLADITPEHGAKSVLFTELVNDALVEYSYDATLAGLSYSLAPGESGLYVYISGYNDKMTVLVEKVLTTMRNLAVKDDRFAIVKEHILEEYENWELQEPYRLIGDYTGWLTGATGWINEEYLAEIPRINASDIREFFPRLLSRVHIEVLANGNLSKDEAVHLSQLVNRCLQSEPLPKSQWDVPRSVLLPEGCDFTYARTLKDPINVNCGIEYYLHVGSRSDRELRAKLLLFAQITEEASFDQLRTKQQLGYVVFSGSKTTATTMGYRILIQSGHEPGFLEEKIGAFLSGCADKLTEMPSEEFDSHKKSLIAKRLEKLKNLSEESRRFWKHIEKGDLNFEQSEEDAESIQPVSKAQIIDFFEQYIRPGSTTRSKLSVHLFSQSAAAMVRGQGLTAQEKLTTLFDILHRVLGSQGIQTQPEKLLERAKGVELEDGHSDALLTVINEYLSTDLGLEPAVVGPITERGKQILKMGRPKPNAPMASPLPNEASATDVANGVDGSQPAKKTVMIEDVHEFKSKLPLSAGIQPVKAASAFHEHDETAREEGS